MSIVDLATCAQEEGESTTHRVRQVKEIIHSSDNMNVGSAVLMWEKNYHFLPLKQKLGRLKRRDGSFAHGYGYPRVPYPKTMGMGKTLRDFLPMGNGYPYPQNIWVGHG